MKLPSFVKLPGHKKFTITPRYYDPIKEEILERTEMIKREMSGEENFGVRAHKITFDRRSSPGPNTSGLQIIIAVGLGIGFYGLALFWKPCFTSPLAYYSHLPIFEIQKKSN